jgi:hypothetical protein
MRDPISRRTLGSNDTEKVVLIRTVLPVFIIITLLCFICGYYVGPNVSIDTVSSYEIDKVAPTESSVSQVSTNEADALAPIIYIYNEYTKEKPLYGNYPWENIVEPYKVTYLAVTNPVQNYRYVWSIDGWHQGEGALITTLFGTNIGSQIPLTLEVRRQSNGEIIKTVDITVICKYVRRELRDLTDQDREAFFSAMSVMQRVPTQVGKKIYGKAYRSRDFFNRIHLYYGGSKSCDHWHQGPGFVTSHIAFEMMFEQSLQSINPSISLPYWDFTLESTFYTPTTFRESGVFSPDWFGDAVCNNSAHTPEEGRFAYAKVMQNADNFSSILSPYGLLKSPVSKRAASSSL